MKTTARDGTKAIKSKVTFHLGDDAWHGHSSESVWAKKLSKNVFQIMSTPFFAMGVSYLDTVLAEEQDGQNTYVSTIQLSGHSTYRIIPNKGTTPAVLEEYWLKLEELGCTYERAELGHTLLAVDVPSSETIGRAYEALQEGADAEVWDFEEGHAHLLNKLS